ncbi:SDR family oxidoreductase [Aeromicrobium sp.]|uniref:SDR family oxidoreductase n=1 Tax=Aeromicrobium sp. TaxID=1871063 RepID=UPI0030BF7443
MITIVTGGTRGIGAGITRALVADGHVVIASYVRDHSAAAALADELEAVRVVQADATTAEGLDALFRPLRRAGEPADIAGVVTWLFGPEASYITATTIRVTGGM